VLRGVDRIVLCEHSMNRLLGEASIILYAAEVVGTL
jgi:hypothetical protein